MTENEIWGQWESQIVNGLFPLRRFLGKSDHSVVFLTDCKPRNLSKAAIKLVPADPATVEVQLAHLQKIAMLSHPHLVRVLDAGQCQLGGHPFLFVVMEYADQTLAQLLQHRALTVEEVQEMLIPALSALAFLHRKNWLQSRLKPPNFLVVNDHLKLASDTVRPVGDSSAPLEKVSLYDAPEAKRGTLNAASDVWGLGISVVEALTQSPPRPGEVFDAAALPAELPVDFADMIRRCLNPDPAARPTIAELEAQLKPAPPATAPAIPPPANIAIPPPADLEVPHKARLLVPAAAVGALVVLAIWTGTHRSEINPTVAPAASRVAQSASPPASPSLAAPPNQMTSTTAAAVQHQEIPGLSRSARESIRGQIKVTVLVTVDRSGKVVAETLQTQGSSKYFARLATEAAKDWRFAPADSPASRQWLLRFEFGRSGATGQALPRGP